MNKPNKDKSRHWIFAAAALLLACLVFAAFFFLLRSAPKQENTVDLTAYNDDCSQILLTGNNYTLEKEQEEIYFEQKTQKEQEAVQQEQQDVPEDMQNAPESIVREELDKIIPQEKPGSGQTGEAEGGSEGGSGPGQNPDGDSSEDKRPYIETNVGSEEYGTNFAFLVRGTDYKGRRIDRYYYTVLLDGNLLYSTEVSSDGWVTYRGQGQPEGYHEVSITVQDTYGNTQTKVYPLNVAAAADVLIDEYVTLEVEADSLGYGYLLYTTERIYKNESAASFVRRVLEAYGFAPGIDDGSYLYRIWGVNTPEPVIPASIKANLDQAFGEHYGTTMPGSLGERDFTPNSGWVYLYNGWFQGVGMYGVTLTDGDIIHIGFTLWGGAEYDGAWGYYGAW